MATIEDLLAEARDKRLRLNNLFEIEAGRWQANFHHENGWGDFGRGATPAAALREAIDRTQSNSKSKAVKTPSIEDLL